ncbi:MAG: hypothetical protein LWX11_10735 [Firmicutes bacterium]|nr:hypothetical protein [Bacillota bacterium]
MHARLAVGLSLLLACGTKAVVVEDVARLEQEGFKPQAASLIEFPSKPSFMLKSYAKRGAVRVFFRAEGGKGLGNTRGWRTVDGLEISLEPNEFLTFGDGTALFEGYADPEIVCLVRKNDDGSWIVQKAWRAHRSLQRFEGVPVSSVQCQRIESLKAQG